MLAWEIEKKGIGTGEKRLASRNNNDELIFVENLVFLSPICSSLRTVVNSADSDIAILICV